MLLNILILCVLLSFESKKTTVLKRVFIIEYSNAYIQGSKLLPNKITKTTGPVFTMDPANLISVSK